MTSLTLATGGNVYMKDAKPFVQKGKPSRKKLVFIQLFTIVLPIYLVILTTPTFLANIWGPRQTLLHTTINTLKISYPEMLLGSWLLYAPIIFVAALFTIGASIYKQLIDPRFETLAIAGVILGVLGMITTIGLGLVFTFGSQLSIMGEINTWGENHLNVSNLSNYHVKDIETKTQYLIDDTGKPVKFLISQQTKNGIVTTTYTLPKAVTK